MNTNYNFLRSIAGIACFTFLPLLSFAQNRGYTDSLGIYRFKSKSEYLDSIIRYVNTTSKNGSYVIALDLKKNCLFAKRHPYIKQFVGARELQNLDRTLFLSSKMKKSQIKRKGIERVSNKHLDQLKKYSYSEFMSKYVNLNSGVLYEIENVDLLNAVLYKLLSLNIGIYVTDNSGDYIIFMEQ